MTYLWKDTIQYIFREERFTGTQERSEKRNIDIHLR